MKSACETTKAWTMGGQTKNNSGSDGGDMGGRSLCKAMNPHSVSVCYTYYVLSSSRIPIFTVSYLFYGSNHVFV